MKRYLYDSRGYYTGSIDVTEFDSFPVNSTTIAPPSLPARWDNTQWHPVENIPDKPVRVPQKIKVKSFKLALHDADLIDTVEAHVTTLPANIKKRVKIELENGGKITLEQAKKLLSGVIDDNVIEQLFIDAG